MYSSTEAGTTKSKAKTSRATPQHCDVAKQTLEMAFIVGGIKQQAQQKWFTFNTHKNHRHLQYLYPPESKDQICKAS